MMTRYNDSTPPVELKRAKEPSCRNPVDKEQNKRVRFHGIPELNSKSNRYRYEHDLKEFKAVMIHLKVHCNVTDIKRQG